jgi:hypothetical protein
MNAMDGFIGNFLIAWQDTTETIIGFARDNRYVIPANGKGFTDRGDHNVFRIIILADNQNSHRGIIAHPDHKIFKAYNEFIMLAKRLHENRFKRALVAPWRNLVKALWPVSYVKYQYRYITHHKLNLKNPTRYTEKLQYLRLFVDPKDPNVIRCAGRVGVRDYVKECGFEDNLIPSLGVYDSFDEIPFEKLPNQFVMKCSHASGFNQIVKDKSALNKEEAKAKFDKWLKTDYGKKTMERHYSLIKPQILIEQYIGSEDSLPVEYKIHVFNGTARNLYVVTGRGKDIRYTQYYIDWTPFDGSQFNGWLKSDTPLEKPKNYEAMVRMAEKLAAPFPFVRVDLYDINGKIYFGEMTFTPAKGTLIFDDDKTDFEQGAWLDISKEMKR